jgi:hypothetical protein
MFIVAVSFATPKTASAIDVDRIEFTKYGIFKMDITKTVDGQDTGARTISEVKNWRIVETTNKIPAKIGTSFGVEYFVSGSPNDSKVNIIEKWVFPSKGILNPRDNKTYYNYEAQATIPPGTRRFIYMGLENEYDLIPGEWTLQLFYGDRKLAEKTFFVYKP